MFKVGTYDSTRSVFYTNLTFSKEININNCKLYMNNCSKASMYFKIRRKNTEKHSLLLKHVD